MERKRLIDRLPLTPSLTDSYMKDNIMKDSKIAYLRYYK